MHKHSPACTYTYRRYIRESPSSPRIVKTATMTCQSSVFVNHLYFERHPIVWTILPAPTAPTYDFEVSFTPDAKPTMKRQGARRSHDGDVNDGEINEQNATSFINMKERSRGREQHAHPSSEIRDGKINIRRPRGRAL